MLAAAIIVFREILEMALIIGIVAAATRGVRHRTAWISSGIAIGCIGALIIALLSNVLIDAMDGMGQEVFNASILYLAVAMLAWHNIWMAKHGRQISKQFHNLGENLQQGTGSMAVLVAAIALAVLREGSEIVLFLHGILAEGGNVNTVLLGGIAGLSAGLIAGLGLYFGLVKIPPRYLFGVTSGLILLLAAGMAAKASLFLSQVDLLPTWGYDIWDTSGLIGISSVTGNLLHSLIGYDPKPTGIQLVSYFLTIIIIGVSMKAVSMKQKSTRGLSVATGSTAAALILSLGLASTYSDRASAGPDAKVYSPYVEYLETELEFRGGIDNDSIDEKDGKQRYLLAIGRGFTEHWFSEVFVKYERLPDASLKTKGYGFENIFQLTERGQYAVDAALYLEYFFNELSNGADTLEIKALLGKDIGATENRFNFAFERDIGANASSDAETEMEYAWQTVWIGESPTLQYGFQAFGSLGTTEDVKSFSDQEARIGPMIAGKTRLSEGMKLKYDAGVGFGLTRETADYNVRFNVELEM